MSRKKDISLIIIDNNRDFRNNLKSLLQLYSPNNLFEFKIIADVDSITQGKPIIEKYKPQILLLDIQLQQESGLDILKYLPKKNYPTKTLILSEHQEEKNDFSSNVFGRKRIYIQTQCC